MASPLDQQHGASQSSAPIAVVRRVDISPRTVGLIAAVLIGWWMLAQLWPMLLKIIIALFLTAALDPLVTRLERKGWPRIGAVALVFGALVSLTALLLVLMIPPLINQGQEFAKNLPEYNRRLERFFSDNQTLFDRFSRAAEQGAADPESLYRQVLLFSTGFISTISDTLLVLVLTVYLLSDGRRSYRWFKRYLPARQRAKLDRALPEISHVVSGYVVGQAITSALFGLFAFLVLTLLDVPEALLLALVAALVDAIPIAGVLIATVPAGLLALTVSVPTAIIVVASYVIYQQVENYIIVPRVYRGTLQISSFAVLIAVLLGGQFLGIIGVLLALPVAAAVPVIERVWLTDWEARHLESDP